MWCVVAISPDRREVPTPGPARRIAGPIRGALPTVRCSVALDHDVATGVLAEHVTRGPACLRGEVR